MDEDLHKVQLVFNQVIDQSAEKYDVTTSANRHPDVGQRTRAREAWIDMNDRSALFLLFHHPAKTNRVRFGHRGTFDQNAICVRQILLRGCSSAPAEGGAQTGHRAAMSYTGLVGQTDHAQGSGEKLFDEIILFVIQCRTAEMTYRRCVIDRNAILLFHKWAFGGFPHPMV